MNTTTILDALLFLCIALAGTSLVTMMAVFTGAEHPALGPLLTAQLVGSALAALLVAGALAIFVAAFGLRRAPAEIWRRLPGWLLFVVVSLVSLVIAGELSYLLVHTVGQRSTTLRDHVPLLAALWGSLGYCAVYAFARLQSRTDG